MTEELVPPPGLEVEERLEGVRLTLPRGERTHERVRNILVVDGVLLASAILCSGLVALSADGPLEIVVDMEIFVRYLLPSLALAIPGPLAVAAWLLVRPTPTLEWDARHLTVRRGRRTLLHRAPLEALRVHLVDRGMLLVHGDEQVVLAGDQGLAVRRWLARELQEAIARHHASAPEPPAPEELRALRGLVEQSRKV